MVDEEAILQVLAFSTIAPIFCEKKICLNRIISVGKTVKVIFHFILFIPCIVMNQTQNTQPTNALLLLLLLF
jgi:hypothetical protein